MGTACSRPPSKIDHYIGIIQELYPRSTIVAIVGAHTRKAVVDSVRDAWVVDA